MNLQKRRISYKILLTGILLSSCVSAQAEISENSVSKYASAMKSAANAQNINQVANLISNDAIISITRNGVAGSMNKAEYLKRLQENWSSTQDYKYSINVSNVVPLGNSAKAKIITTETFTKNGKSVQHVTQSRATLTESGNKAVLLKSVSQVVIK